jgi:hypothetical protein
MIFIMIISLMPTNFVKAAEAPQKVVVTNYILDMIVGSKQTLDIKVTPSGVDNSVYITSSDETIVRVYNAQKKLSAVSEGKANISITTSNGKSYNFTITVYPKDAKIVTSEAELKSILKTMKLGTLVISSTKKENISVPAGKYNKINLYIDMPVGKLVNKGTFKSVNNVLLSENLFETSIQNNTITIIGISNKNITSLKIPKKIAGKKVTAIAEDAFSGCEKLTSIIIPEGVISVATNTLSGCLALTEITIPSSLIDIDRSVFTNCRKLKHINLPDKLNSNLTWLRRYENKEMAAIFNILETDTTRWGMWDLTYKEFIEIYRSIGTDNDLFLKMLKEKGARHTDSTKWFNYDGLPGVEIRFNDILTEKIYALHYAPFEYNSEDLLRGDYGKDTEEAYLDHGGVCSILANTYGHFIYYILGETNWEYAYYANDEVDHEVLVIRTEDGKCFQIDNCGVDYWWLGIQTIPDMQKVGNDTSDSEWTNAFNEQKNYLNTSEELLWYDFIIADYDFDKGEWKGRPIWYDYNINDWNAYLGHSTPMYYVCNYIGIDKIISMAGYTNLDGYIDIDKLEFSKP